LPAAPSYYRSPLAGLLLVTRCLLFNVLAVERDDKNIVRFRLIH
jgi:hypothetical protein